MKVKIENFNCSIKDIAALLNIFSPKNDLQKLIKNYPKTTMKIYEKYRDVFWVVDSCYQRRVQRLYCTIPMQNEDVIKKFVNLLCSFYQETLLRINKIERAKKPEKISEKDILIKIFDSKKEMDKEVKIKPTTEKLIIGIPKRDIAVTIDRWYCVYDELLFLAEINNIIQLNPDENKGVQEWFTIGKNIYRNKSYFYLQGFKYLMRAERDGNFMPSMIEIFRKTIGDYIKADSKNYTQKHFGDVVNELKNKYSSIEKSDREFVEKAMAKII